MSNRVEDSLWVSASYELIHKFNINKIDYLIVGGCAVAWYWEDRPLAQDLDLMVKPEKNNSIKIFKCLKNILYDNNKLTENFFSE